MLRALQTNALSDKVAKLFETSTPTPKFHVRPVNTEAKRPSHDWSTALNAPLSGVRRRRARRRHPASPTGAIRTSWF